MIKTNQAMPRLMILCAILIVTFLAFGPCLYNGFVNWDDPVHLTENSRVFSLTPASIARIFSKESCVNRTYVPLTLLSFAVEYHFFKLNPFFYHLDSLLLHLAVVALVFFLSLRLGLGNSGAAVCALLFALHPLHVEPVAWVTSRKDVLYSFFYLLSLHAYVSYVRQGKGWYYALVLVGCLLSILAKPMALSLPLILFLFDWFLSRKFSRKVFYEKSPFFLMAVLLAGITFLRLLHPFKQPLFEGVLLWVWTFMFYLFKFIYPARLMCLYAMPEPIRLVSASYGFAVVGFGVFLALLWVFRRQRWFVFACLFYFLSIFFLMRFEQGFHQCIVADRYMYLPSFGFCLLAGFLYQVGCGKCQGRIRRKIFLVALVALLFVSAAVSVQRLCPVWKNSTTLWSRVIQIDPDQKRAYINRGNDLLARKQVGLALRDYAMALKLDPYYDMVYNNRGVVYTNLGKYDLALADFNRALRIYPNYDSAYANRGNLHFYMGQYEKALADFGWALAITPKNKEVLNNRGMVYLTQKEIQKALDDFESALRIDPFYQEALEHKKKAEVLLKLSLPSGQKAADEQ